MEKFQLPEDVTINMDGNTITISRGVINYQELNIDQEQSSSLFISTIKELVYQKEVEVSDGGVISDLSVLVEMGYLTKTFEKTKYSKILFIVDDNELNFYSTNLPNEVSVVSANEFSSDTRFNKLRKINDLENKISLMDEIAHQFNLAKYDHIFIVDTYYHINRIRIFNLLLKHLNKIGTFSISDYSLLFVTTIMHGDTGCFECLENQIRTKLKKTSVLDEEYIEKDDYLELGEKSLKFGFTSSVLESIIKQNNTNTLGNVIEFDNQTMEYYFDSNRIQTSCSICATQNNIFHEEQNMKTIKMLNSLKG